MPVERVLARARGWHGADGALPFAAHEAQLAGLAVGDVAWGRLTPMYWHVGADHLTALPLRLQERDEQDARALFEAVQPLFTSQGWLLVWLRADYWLTAHESLDGLPTASLDRVAGRNPDAWMPDHPQARAIKLLQNEAQMLWYTHPVTDERVARGEMPINSLWLSDCGMHQAANANVLERVDTLRDSLWNNDWDAWVQAWSAVDREVARPLVAKMRAGERFKLTLGGERHARTWSTRRRPWWTRITQPRATYDVAGVLRSL